MKTLADTRRFPFDRSLSFLGSKPWVKSGHFSLLRLPSNLTLSFLHCSYFSCLSRWFRNRVTILKLILKLSDVLTASAYFCCWGCPLPYLIIYVDWDTDGFEADSGSDLNLRTVCPKLLLKSETRYYSQGTIIADSRDEAKGLIVITSGQVMSLHEDRW